MELIVISNPVAVADESMIINHLFQSGLKYLHIRKPGSDIKAVRDLVNGITPLFYDRISLHQFHEIAPDYGITRLHYTEQARTETSGQKIQLQIDQGYKLSTSIHDTAVLNSLAGFDYVFYGPVFNSLSKPGYQSRLPADFKLNKANTNPRVIALGGVEKSNLVKIKAMNFDGAAVLGTIWNEPDKSLARFLELNKTYLF